MTFTPHSRDHQWGPRLLLFRRDDTDPHFGEEIEQALAARLPATFRGYSTSFSPRDAQGVRLLVSGAVGHVPHHVDLWTLGAFTRMELGIASNRSLQARNWLVLPEQKLLQVTAGAVYHDGLGTLTALRERLAYYPRAVWL